jgi:hypothetical protein
MESNTNVPIFWLRNRLLKYWAERQISSKSGVDFTSILGPGPLTKTGDFENFRKSGFRFKGT